MCTIQLDGYLTRHRAANMSSNRQCFPVHKVNVALDFCGEWERMNGITLPFPLCVRGSGRFSLILRFIKSFSEQPKWAEQADAFSLRVCP